MVLDNLKLIIKSKGGIQYESLQNYFKMSYSIDLSSLHDPIGKASHLDHSWPDNIDHTTPELSTCYLVLYDDCNLTGHIWSLCLVFV